MPAIVRVKRRIDEEPLNAFVLNGKKRRLEQTAETETESSINAIANEDGKDEISTVLKFAGTILEPDNNATTQFARLINKNDAKDLVQGKSARKAANLTERARQDVRATAQENRFRVVNCMRTTLEKEDGTDGGGVGTDDVAGASKPDEVKSLTIVDIEKQTNETETSMPMQQQQQQQQQAQPMPADSDTGYVYDLYLPDDDVQARNADLMDDNYLSILPVDNICFEDIYNDAEDDDSEDSNREDYFTNDYPDEDDDQELHSANEYDDNESEAVRNMRRAVENFVFGDDDDSERDIYDDASSEDGADYYTYEDPYVQSIEYDNFVPDIDAYEGSSYESYKKKLKKRLGKDFSDEDDDDDKDEEESDEDANGKLNRSSDLDYHSANEQD